MIRKILVASDGALLSEHVMENAIELAKATGASIVGLIVTEPYPLTMYADLMLLGIETVRDYQDQERELANRVLAPIERAAESAAVTYSSASVCSGSPADAIVATAEQQGCDLICIALGDYHGLLGAHLGKETSKVLTRARIPVLVCH